MFDDVELPDWLKRFHAMVDFWHAGELAHAGLKLRYRPFLPVKTEDGRRVETAEAEGAEYVVSWLDRVAASDDFEPSFRDNLALKVADVRDWLQGIGNMEPQRAKDVVGRAVVEVRNAASAFLETRTTAEKKLAFLGEFWIVDQERTGADVAVVAVANRLGIDENKRRFDTSSGRKAKTSSRRFVRSHRA